MQKWNRKDRGKKWACRPARWDWALHPQPQTLAFASSGYVPGPPGAT